VIGWQRWLIQRDSWLNMIFEGGSMEEQSRSKAASILSGYRVREVRICQLCSTQFTALSSARFCSTACRSKAYRQRKVESQTPA